MIRLKRKSQTKRKKKIAAAVYLYQVDNDGEWGEISFDFEAGTAEIIRLAGSVKYFSQKSLRGLARTKSVSNGGVLRGDLQVLHVHVLLVAPLSTGYMTQSGTD